MDAYPREAWERLGQRLKQRRPQIDTRYRVRKIFAEEHDGLTDKTVQEIENAYRTTFSDVMLSTIEAAYQLKGGSIERFLAGDGELEPLDPVVQVGQPRLTVPERAAGGLRIAQVDDTHLRVDLTIDTDVTMAEVYARLGELSPNERAMVANMEALEVAPAEIGGAVLLLRRFRERRAERLPQERRKA